LKKRQHLRYAIVGKVSLSLFRLCWTREVDCQSGAPDYPSYKPETFLLQGECSTD